MDVVVGSLELEQLDDERLVSSAQEALQAPVLEVVVRVLRLALLCAGPSVAWMMKGRAFELAAGLAIGVLASVLLGAVWRRAQARRVQAHLQILRARYGQALVLERLRAEGQIALVMQGRHLPHGEHFFVRAVLGPEAALEVVRGPLIELRGQALPLEGIKRLQRSLSKEEQAVLRKMIDAPLTDAPTTGFDGSPCQVLRIEGERVERAYCNLSQREEESEVAAALLARQLYEFVGAI